MGNDSSFQAFFLSNVVWLLLGEVDNNAEQHLDQLDLVLHGGEPVGPEGRVELKMSSDFFYINKRMTSWSFKHFCCQNVAIMPNPPECQDWGGGQANPGNARILRAFL